MHKQNNGRHGTRISRTTDTFADATNIADHYGELEPEHQFNKRKYTMIRSIALATALLTPIAAFAQDLPTAPGFDRMGRIGRTRNPHIT